MWKCSTAHRLQLEGRHAALCAVLRESFPYSMPVPKEVRRAPPESSSACPFLPAEGCRWRRQAAAPWGVRRCLTLKWATRGFAPVIKGCLNVPAASCSLVPLTPRTSPWLEWCIMLCSRHCARGRKLSSLLTSQAHDEGAFPIPCKWTRIPLGRFSSGGDAEAILQGH